MCVCVCVCVCLCVCVCVRACVCMRVECVLYVFVGVFMGVREGALCSIIVQKLYCTYIHKSQKSQNWDISCDCGTFKNRNLLVVPIVGTL